MEEWEDWKAGRLDKDCLPTFQHPAFQPS